MICGEQRRERFISFICFIFQKDHNQKLMWSWSRESHYGRVGIHKKLFLISNDALHGLSQGHQTCHKMFTLHTAKESCITYHNDKRDRFAALCTIPIYKQKIPPEFWFPERLLIKTSVHEIEFSKKAMTFISSTIILLARKKKRKKCQKFRRLKMAHHLSVVRAENASIHSLEKKSAFFRVVKFFPF